MHRWEDDEELNREVRRMDQMQWAVDAVLAAINGKRDDAPGDTPGMVLDGGRLDGERVADTLRYLRVSRPGPDDPDQRMIVDEYERLIDEPRAIYVGRRRAGPGEV